MHRVATAGAHDAFALVSAQDEDLAARSSARLLITAPTHRGVEMVARRIHAAGRAECPFIHTWACDLPVDPKALSAKCSSLLDAAASGSVLISNVEQMAPRVQDVLLEVLTGLEVARRPSPPVRLISGTTVSLLDRVASGAFSELLFYRLNIIHVSAGDVLQEYRPSAEF